MFRLLACLMMIVVCSKARGQIVINELGIAPSASSLEFIELFNKSSCAIDISCYTIVFSGTSGSGNPTGWTVKIPSGKSIAACGYFLIGGIAGAAGVVGGTGYPTGGVVTSYPTADLDIGSTAITTNAVFMRQGVNAGTLPNSSGQISLLNDFGVVVASLSYNNGNNPGSYPLSAYTTCNLSGNSQGINNISNPGTSLNNVNASFSAAGFQGVYLNAAGNYIVSGSLSPGTNNLSQMGCAPSIVAPVINSVCFNNNAQTTFLSYSSTTNFPTHYSITWAPIPANNFVNVLDAPFPGGPITINIPAGTPAATYTGNITLSNATGSSCNVPITLLINPLPAVNAGTYAPVCAGNGIIPLMGAPVGGSFSGTGVSANIFTVPTIPGSYTVLYSYTSAFTGCNNIATATITVNPLPVITISGNNTVCFGDATTLQASGASIYGWSPSTGLSSTTGSSVIANPSSNTVYTVTGIDANGCSNTGQIVVDVDSMPLTLPLITTIQPSCTSPAGSITVDVPIANSYQYSIDGSNYQPSNFFPNVPGGSYLVTVRNGPGCTSRAVIVNIVGIEPPTLQIIDTSACERLVYNGTLYTASAVIRDTLKNQSGCDSVVRTINILIHPKPQLTVTPDQTVCSGNSVVLSATSTNGLIQWLGFSVGNTISIFPTVTTTYTAVATTLNGCTDTAHTTITVSDFDIQLFANPNPVISGINSFLNTSSNTSYQVIAWKPVNIFPNQVSRFQSLIIDSSLLITVIARSNSGCIDSASTTIVIDPLNDVFVPTAFTPNGDGKNDVFRVLGGKIEKLDFKIFNRWGQLIFATDERTKGWDGNFVGRPQLAGNYTYVLRAVLQNGIVINKKGTVLLIR